MAFDRVAVLGTGLIGSSVGLAIKAAHPTAQIVGYDASSSTAREAARVHAVDRTGSLADVLRDAQLVVLATPVGGMRALFQEIGPLVQPGTVVTDTGSTKGRVLEWAQEFLPEGVHFVGGHPMAGKTTTGPSEAEATLFRGAVWCLVPSPSTPQSSIDEMVKLVESFGAVPYFVDANEHDGLVAAISHLPYLMSVALIDHLGSERSWRETASLAAGGFAYTTHLSDSDPQMFADIARTNRDNIVRRLDRYTAALTDLREAIASDDAGLKERFERARSLHQDWLSGRAQGTTEESAGEMPSKGSMVAGSLFGRWGKKKD